MDFKVTTDDGSEYLMHHGTKGMQWGVWNEETKKKYGYGGSSARGDRLRKKAAAQKAKADKARTNTALMDKTAKVHSAKITEAYSKANAHLIKGNHHMSRSVAYANDANSARARGDEKLAKKLDKKGAKEAGKQQRERLLEEREKNKGKMLANHYERENQARMELAKEAAKHDKKAAKLEVKAAKADIRQEGKMRRAVDDLRGNAKGIADKHAKAEKMEKEAKRDLKAGKMDEVGYTEVMTKWLDRTLPDYTENAAMVKSARKVVNASGNKAKGLGITWSSQQSRRDYEQRVRDVLATSLKEVGVKSSKVDKIVEEALQDADAYDRGAKGMQWGVWNEETKQKFGMNA